MGRARRPGRRSRPRRQNPPRLPDAALAARRRGAARHQPAEQRRVIRPVVLARLDRAEFLRLASRGADGSPATGVSVLLASSSSRLAPPRTRNTNSANRSGTRCSGVPVITRTPNAASSASSGIAAHVVSSACSGAEIAKPIRPPEDCIAATPADGPGLPSAMCTIPRRADQEGRPADDHPAGVRVLVRMPQQPPGQQREQDRQRPRPDPEGAADQRGQRPAGRRAEPPPGRPCRDDRGGEHGEPGAVPAVRLVEFAGAVAERRATNPTAPASSIQTAATPLTSQPTMITKGLLDARMRLARSRALAAWACCGRGSTACRRAARSPRSGQRRCGRRRCGHRWSCPSRHATGQTRNCRPDGLSGRLAATPGGAAVWACRTLGRTSRHVSHGNQHAAESQGRWPECRRRPMPGSTRDPVRASLAPVRIDDRWRARSFGTVRAAVTAGRRKGRRECGSRSWAADPAGCTSPRWPSNSLPRTRSPSGSGTRPTTRSASAWCSPTRRSAGSSTPTRRSTRRWSASSPAGTTSTCTTATR